MVLTEATSSTTQSTDFHALYANDTALTLAKEKGQDMAPLESLYVEIISGASLSDNAKLLAASLIPRHMHLYPHLAEPAINAQIDLCEMMDKTIRMRAISNLHLLCRNTPQFVPRIADILVQMLVTDDSQEMVHVCQGFRQVLSYDKKGALGAIFGHLGRGPSHPLFAKACAFLQKQILSREHAILQEPGVMECLLDLSEKVVGLFHEEDFISCFKLLAKICGFEIATKPEPPTSTATKPETTQKPATAPKTTTNAAAARPNQKLQQQQIAQQMFESSSSSAATPTRAAGPESSEGRALMRVLVAWTRIPLAGTVVIDPDVSHRLAVAAKLALPLLKNGVPDGGIVSGLFNHVVRQFDKIGSNAQQLAVLRVMCHVSTWISPDMARIALPALYSILLGLIPASPTAALPVDLTEPCIYLLYQCGNRSKGQLNRSLGIRLPSGIINDGSLEDHSDLRSVFNTKMGELSVRCDQMFEASKKIVEATTPPCALTEKKHYVGRTTMMAAFNTKAVAAKLVKAKSELPSIATILLSWTPEAQTKIKPKPTTATNTTTSPAPAKGTKRANDSSQQQQQQPQQKRAKQTQPQSQRQQQQQRTTSVARVRGRGRPSSATTFAGGRKTTAPTSIARRGGGRGSVRGRGRGGARM